MMTMIITHYYDHDDDDVDDNYDDVDDNDVDDDDDEYDNDDDDDDDDDDDNVHVPRHELRQCVRLTREILAQSAFDQFRGPEISPGPEIQTDEEIDAFVR